MMSFPGSTASASKQRTIPKQRTQNLHLTVCFKEACSTLPHKLSNLYRPKDESKAIFFISYTAGNTRDIRDVDDSSITEG